jgi:hypothetical protein
MIQEIRNDHSEGHQRTRTLGKLISYLPIGLSGLCYIGRFRGVDTFNLAGSRVRPAALHAMFAMHWVWRIKEWPS